jgi:hypothetical protein
LSKKASWLPERKQQRRTSLDNQDVPHSASWRSTAEKLYLIPIREICALTNLTTRKETIAAKSSVSNAKGEKGEKTMTADVAELTGPRSAKGFDEALIRAVPGFLPCRDKKNWIILKKKTCRIDGE